MRGDIDERPSEAYNRTSNPVNNLGLLQPSASARSPTSIPSPSLSVNDEHLKSKTIQDILRTTRPASVEPLPPNAPNSTSAGPSFDFISMIEQLKQPRLAQSMSVFHSLLRSSWKFVSFSGITLMILWKSVARPVNRPHTFCVLFSSRSDRFPCLIDRYRTIHALKSIKRRCPSGQNGLEWIAITLHFHPQTTTLHPSVLNSSSNNKHRTAMPTHHGILVY